MLPERAHTSARMHAGMQARACFAAALGAVQHMDDLKALATTYHFPMDLYDALRVRPDGINSGSCSLLSTDSSPVLSVRRRNRFSALWRMTALESVASALGAGRACALRLHR
jgi:hypothetical protein